MSKEKQINNFIYLCKLTQKQLAKEVCERLKNIGYKPIKKDGFVYAKGEIPVCLLAHLDTVHKEKVKETLIQDRKGKIIISSPQGIGGDDRCGVFMILEIAKKYKCSVLFCEDEEIGGIGAEKFTQTKHINDLKELKYLIELDRANRNDAVFYDCDNPNFTKFITKNTKYKEKWGSFSDISVIAPDCGVAAVNLSCGYYHAHSTKEEVVFEDMLKTIETVKNLLSVECEQFEYIEAKHSFGRGYLDDWYYGYDNYYPSKDGYFEAYIQYYEIVDNKCVLKETTIIGSSENEALGAFFIDHPAVCMNDFEMYEPYTEDERSMYEW